MTEPTASVALLLATALLVLVMSDLPCYFRVFFFARLIQRCQKTSA